jgi:hypothetical protein
LAARHHGLNGILSYSALVADDFDLVPRWNPPLGWRRVLKEWYAKLSGLPQVCSANDEKFVGGSSLLQLRIMLRIPRDDLHR